MLSKKKKLFIISGFCLLLVITGCLNIFLNNKIASEASGGNVVTAGNFFSTYRTDRTDTRNEEILYLDAIIASSSASAESKTAAETKKTELIALMETELALEGLIKAKGFEDVVVSTSTSNINVIVKSAELQESEVAQIVDVIKGQTEYDLDNIKIFPVE
ncbi:MAG: SpoIIIAH-like family protein [Clostridia bacterium]|nr:SpoIIIAH-like family protein [Clostridia bacterium]